MTDRRTLSRTHRARPSLTLSFALYLIGGLLAPVGASVSAQTVYTVAVQDIDYYPIYRSSPENGSYDGYLRELLDTFAHAHDIRFEYRPRPVRRGAAEFLGGEYDFMLPAHPQWNRIEKAGKRVHYSRPLVFFEDAILVLEENRDMRPEQLQQLGTVHGFTAWKFIDDIEAGRLQVETARTPRNLIFMAFRGRVDAINLALPVARYYLADLKAKGELVLAPQLMAIERSRYHLATLKYPETIDKLNRFLAHPPSDVARVVRDYERFGLTGPGDEDWPPTPAATQVSE